MNNTTSTQLNTEATAIRAKMRAVANQLSNDELMDQIIKCSCDFNMDQLVIDVMTDVLERRIPTLAFVEFMGRVEEAMDKLA